jgi:hypothetical protein
MNSAKEKRKSQIYKSKKNKVSKLILKECLSSEKISKKKGSFLNINNDTVIIRKDTDIFLSKGDLLLKFRTKCIDSKLCNLVHKNIRSAAQLSQNRGDSSGKIKNIKDKVYWDSRSQQFYPLKKGMTYYSRIKKNGEPEKYNSAKKVYSGAIGFTQNVGGFGKIFKDKEKCRMMTWNKNHLKEWNQSIQYFQRLSNLFKKLVPNRYKVQLKAADSVIYKIPGTCFTTVTVNKNFRTALHQDANDLKEGFGILTCFGKFNGGLLYIPQYNVAVDLQEGDFLAFDVHQWHCNTPIKVKKVDEGRISLVSYMREPMLRSCPKKNNY